MLCRLFLNGCARIGVLALGVREKLDGENVSIAVDDAAEQHGPCLGGIGRALADARHEPGDDAHIGGKPDKQRDRETQVRRPEQSERAQPLHGNEHGGVAELQDRIAHRRRRLHQFVGHPAREVVLKETQALAQHVPVRLPAHPRLERRREHLALGQLVSHKNDRPGDQHDERHPQQEPRVLGEERCRIGYPPEQVDKVGDELSERHLGQGREQVEDQNHQKCRPDGRDEMPVEGPQRPRRMLGCRALEWIDARFKPAKHAAIQDFFGRARVMRNVPSAASNSRRSDPCHRRHTG